MRSAGIVQKRDTELINMHRLDDLSQLIKALWDECTRLLQSVVLSYCGLGGLVGTGSGMPELHLRR